MRLQPAKKGPATAYKPRGVIKRPAAPSAERPKPSQSQNTDSIGVPASQASGTISASGLHSDGAPSQLTPPQEQSQAPDTSADAHTNASATSGSATTSLKRKESPAEEPNEPAKKRLRAESSSPVTKDPTIVSGTSVEVPISKGKEAQVEKRVAPSQKGVRVPLPSSSVAGTPNAASESLQDEQSPSVIHGREISSQTQTTNESQQSLPEESASSSIPTPQDRQDNPSSVYPDPELSAIRRPGATRNPDGAQDLNVTSSSAGSQPETSSSAPAPKKTKRAPAKNPRKRKARAQTDEDNDDPNTGMSEGELLAKARKKPKKTSTRKKRAETPEDAENITIDTSSTMLLDLIKDVKTGRKFSKADKVKETLAGIEEAKKLRQYQLAHPEEHENTIAAVAGGADAEGEVSEGAMEDDPSPADQQGLSVDEAGNWILDSGGQLDLHAKHRNIPITSTLEDDWSRPVNQNTAARQKLAQDAARPDSDIKKKFYEKGQRCEGWDELDTDTFYMGLGAWGEDFTSIADMFGKKRTRRHIKLKAKWESNNNPHKYNRVLAGGAVDECNHVEIIEIYKDEMDRSAGGRETAEEIQEKLEADRRMRQAEIDAMKAEAVGEAQGKKDVINQNRTGSKNSKNSKGSKNSERNARAKEILGIGAESNRNAGEVSATPKQRRKRNAPVQNPNSSRNTAREVVLGSIEI